MSQNWTQYIKNIPDFPKPGIDFKDITPLLSNGEAFKQVIELMADICGKDDVDPDVLACPEARGFIFASALAYRLEIGFLPIRKPGKLPRKTASNTYDLEYGSDELQIHVDDIRAGQRIVLVDDVLATGGTMASCIKLLQEHGADVRACVFLMELEGLGGREKIESAKLQNVTIHSLVKY